MNATVLQIQRAITLIESSLFDDIALRDLARKAGCSPWHFHRLFSAMIGETPLGYARRRRLGELCRRLVETDTPMIQIALSGGFESQAAFTRAFTRQIGVSPGRYRQAGVLNPGNCYPPLDVAEWVVSNRRSDMKPRIEHKSAFSVIGIAGHFAPNTNTRIPELWGRFAPREAEIPNRRGQHAFGICGEADEGGSAEECGFVYTAAVEVDSIEQVPPGMVALTIPANTYAVFTHKGHISTIGATMKQVFGSWLPEAAYEHVPGPDFEFYDERFDPERGEGEVDIYVPVRPTA